MKRAYVSARKGALPVVGAALLLLLRCTPHPATGPVAPPVGKTAGQSDSLARAGKPNPAVAHPPRKNADSVRLAQKSATMPADSPYGSIRLYSPRAVMDFPFSRLAGSLPDSGADAGSRILTITDASRTSVIVKIRPGSTNCDGAPINALNLIDQWTRFIREHPAQGKVLFQSCEGIAQFIKGREPVIRGLVPVDNTTIRIRLAQPDPDAAERLRSSGILPPAMKTGRYSLKAVRENEITLYANSHAPGKRPFVKEAVIRCGGDQNPLLSFSIGRYDAVALWNKTDIDYARTTLLKKECSLVPVGRERYFVALRVKDAALRAYIASLLSPAALLRDSRADGVVVSAIETDSLARDGLAVQPVPAQRPAIADPLKIYYRKDDGVSKFVAEKLLAACARVNVPARIFPQTLREYESTLAGSACGCMVGWMDESVLWNKSERLRLSAMFFGEEHNEGARIGQNSEIPLFSATWYLLMKSKVGLLNGKIDDIFIKPATVDR